MSFDLTNKNISDTFQHLLQKATGSSGHLYDLKGNQVTDLTIAGTLHAQSYIISQSVLNVSSGSTVFGDTEDDSHTSIGNITASGNISASGKITALAFGTGTGENGLYDTGAGLNKLTISSSNDIVLNGGDDIFFQSEGTTIVQIKGDEAILDLNGTEQNDTLETPDLSNEFQIVGAGGCSEEDAYTQQAGDMNGDGNWNVMDIVILAYCIIQDNCDVMDAECAGDINGDDGWNVLDIVTLSNCVLSDNCEDL